MADRYAERHKRRVTNKWNLQKMRLVHLFFTRHPSPAPTAMNLTDFKMEFPDFTVCSLAHLKGLRTELKKKGVFNL